MRLLLDAMISKVVAEQLRRRGYDVQAVQERSLAERRLTDPEQLARATAEGRALVTYNFHDFVPLSRQWAVEGKAYGGLVLIYAYSIPQHQIGAQVRALAALLQNHPTDDALHNQTIVLLPKSQASK